MSEPFSQKYIGFWQPGSGAPQPLENGIQQALCRVNHPVFILLKDNRQMVAQDGKATLSTEIESGGRPLLALAPALPPSQLGDPVFKATYGLKYAYVAGAMANGISSTAMVKAVGKSGMMGVFGAAGLEPSRVEAAIDDLEQTMGNAPFGFNLIHSPGDPRLEEAVVDLYLRRGIRTVSASAYLGVTLALVRYRVSGIHRSAQGGIVCPNKVIAKVSREEVARRFFSPPPEKLLAELVRQKRISAEQAQLAASIPLAEDLTAEADSGGHTDNRPALALLPTMIGLRDEIARAHHYPRAPRVGLGGGVATPESAAAAFAMGAAYILTGSVNQACTESGTSDTVRQMLAEVQQADVTMAPAADMFEMGVKVQVLKRGTMFAMRAARLYDIYRNHQSWEDIPEKERLMLERDYFRCPFEEEWTKTHRFFTRRDPTQIDRALTDPRHKMALVFRSYLGQSSRWANAGEPGRRLDYQIWCGPSMGSFNAWAKGSFLDDPKQRSCATVAMNLLLGASVVTRAGWLRNQAVALPAEAVTIRPMTMSTIQALVEG
jgi:trans-AT polyketide synthase/acyltransferase/oxidoreductase domain-containing protein